MSKIAHELIKFIKESPTVFHVVDNIGKKLEKNGFTQLKEGENWDIKPNGSYYVVRNRSSILAFTVPKADFNGFNIIASHGDSPSFKIKENPEMANGDNYVTVNTERYGGMIMSTWMDRPLSVAGRVIVKDGEKFSQKLVCVDKDLLIIPSVAIHMDRTANEGKKFNAQVDTIPLFGGGNCKGKFLEMIASEAGVDKDDILGSDLFLYNRQDGAVVGGEGEFVCSPKLDDLQCAFASMEGFLQAKNAGAIPVLAVFDNEEVGSVTKQGAASTFLSDTLSRVNTALGNTQEHYHKALANSFMVSADNAHALHPNHGSYADPTNKPIINKGVVIKHSANQKYTTDGVSAAVFKSITKELKLPCQSFVNRSDSMGGSTLGNISTFHVSISSVDIGLPQLAMHSSYETAGIKDTEDFVKIAKAFFSKEKIVVE